VIGEATRAQLPPGAVTEALPELQLKGKAQPVKAYVLHSVS
jgi:class 3 adenylate cyclase